MSWIKSQRQQDGLKMSSTVSRRLRVGLKKPMAMADLEMMRDAISEGEVAEVQPELLAAHNHHLRLRGGVPDDSGDLAHEGHVGVPVRQLVGLQVVLEHVRMRAVLEGQRIEYAVLEQRRRVRVQEPLQRG